MPVGSLFFYLFNFPALCFFVIDFGDVRNYIVTAMRLIIVLNYFQGILLLE